MFKNYTSYLSTLIFFFVIVSANGQSKATFFNKKIVVDIVGTGSYQVFTGSVGYYGSALQRESKKPIFGYGAQIFYAFNNEFMLGFSYASDLNSVQGPNFFKGNDSFSEYYADIIHERLDLRQKSYGLLFGIGNNSSNFPSGFGLNFGVSLRNLTIEDKDYNYRINNSFLVEESEKDFENARRRLIDKFSNNYISFIFEPLKRVSINKSLAIYYGVRLQASFQVSGGSFEMIEKQLEFSNVDFRRIALTNFATLKLGMSFML